MTGAAVLAYALRLVNALAVQGSRRAAKSDQEEFGRVMWSGVAVIGVRNGGIGYQFEDGVNGFLVDAVDQAADQIVALL